ncbi:MAG: peptide-methionine (S)-S-oxide reductase MsrA [Acidobacteriia bacterium]|nr:peptide-methionine (S)-S-oxide reductase MsrA [Terriglobia bacterium]
MANSEIAILGGGCFWCLEAVFDRVKGVQAVESGYMGGTVDKPTYQQVCDGDTGHAEIVRIAFDPKEISFPELLEVFFTIHDPTTLNRQGNDVGTQYRSVIFYTSDAQRQAAQRAIAELNASRTLPGPVVTAVEPAGTFFMAEAYHQEYYVNNSNQSYCRFVVEPKIDKFMKHFAERVSQRA